MSCQEEKPLRHALQPTNCKRGVRSQNTTTAANPSTTRNPPENWDKVRIYDEAKKIKANYIAKVPGYAL